MRDSSNLVAKFFISVHFNLQIYPFFPTKSIHPPAGQVAPSRNRRQILRGRCPGGIWGRKRYLFLRGMGCQPPAEQKNSPILARKVHRRHLGQKKVSFPARNGMPTACRAGKQPNSCAEGASEAFGASVHMEGRFVDARLQSV